MSQRAWTDKQAADLLDALMREAKTRTGYGHCQFCGAHCYGRTCQAHRDLVEAEHVRPTVGDLNTTKGA